VGGGLLQLVLAVPDQKTLGFLFAQALANRGLEALKELSNGQLVVVVVDI